MMTVNCEHLLAQEFRDRLAAAKPGEIIIYATGFLAPDIQAACLSKHPHAGALVELGRVTLRASDNGEAFLTQRRVGERCFEYRAQKPMKLEEGS